MVECVNSPGVVLGGHAVARNPQVEFAHIGIGSREENTVIRRYSANDQGARLQLLQQKPERRSVERGMAWLEDRVVAWCRREQLDQLPAGNILGGHLAD